jgi:hypothetical protein
MLCFVNFMRKRFSAVDWLNILEKKNLTVGQHTEDISGPHVSVSSSPGGLHVVDKAILELTASLTISNGSCLNNSSIIRPITNGIFQWTSDLKWKFVLYQRWMNLLLYDAVFFRVMFVMGSAVQCSAVQCSAVQCPVFWLHPIIRLTTQSRNH